ncbi:MAG: patatin-like phospholipase family protein [Deltaproteobacteria bacterium]|nr:patatin-like phospholipase family protein [Deltaproteobacteria bacterium]
MRHKIRDFLCLVFIVCLVSVPVEAKADQPVPPARPRIGLVLSGGGARGAAHIGVIKVLEEMKIPIDYVAGTSMGAIVGGLYASGFSPAEMEKIVTGIEWNNAFMDKPSPQELSFRRKQDAADYMIDFDLGFKNGHFHIPKGLVQGQNLNMILKSLLFHAETIHDFDKLNIPFRAVAADIETGNTVVLQSGELVKAIRASMSIPMVFAPVEIDGKILVDGGIANNIPVDVVRQMGADVLIVVDIGTPLRTREKLVSAVSISSQVMTILIHRNSMEQLAKLRPGDIHIAPPLGDLGTGDFARAPEAVRIGQAKAMSMKPLLQRFSLDEKGYHAYLARQRKGSPEQPKIDYVRIDNKSPLSKSVIESQIRTQPGDKLDMEKLKKDITRTYGLDFFERVDFSLEKKDGETGLIIEPTEKSWGPNYLRFGFGVEDNFKGDSAYGLSTRFTKTALNRLGGEWRNEAQIGSNLRLFSEFYQPVDYAMNYFVATGIEYKERNANAFSPSGDVAAQYRISSTQVGLDVGRQFGNWGELRFGVRRTTGNVSLKIGSPDGGAGSFDRGSLYSSFAYSKLDSYSFPLVGSDAKIIWMDNLKELGSDITGQAMTFNWLTAATWGKFTLVPGIRIQTAMDSDDAPIQDSYPVGGFLNLSGFALNELSGRHTGVARLIGYRKMGSTGLGAFNMPLYLGGSAEAGNVWDKRADITFQSILYAGSVFIGTSTYLGPIYLAYGHAEGGHKSLYLYLGRQF